MSLRCLRVFGGPGDGDLASPLTLAEALRKYKAVTASLGQQLEAAHAETAAHDKLMEDERARMRNKFFKVKHQKLTETVNHDDVNFNNYMKFKPNMSRYLENHIIGL